MSLWIFAFFAISLPMNNGNSTNTNNIDCEPTLRSAGDGFAGGQIG